MSKVCVRGFAISTNGFGAGPEQSLDHPMGKGGRELHKWFFPTKAFRSMIGQEGGTEDRFASAAVEGFGAFILGRNMFGPVGDDWGGPDWKGVASRGATLLGLGAHRPRSLSSSASRQDAESWRKLEIAARKSLLHAASWMRNACDGHFRDVSASGRRSIGAISIRGKPVFPASARLSGQSGALRPAIYDESWPMADCPVWRTR